MTTTAPAAGSALAPLVDVLLAEPLNTLDVPELQARIETVTPQVARLQGWLTAAAGQLDTRTGGSVPDDDTGRPRSVAGWLAQVQHGTASAAGSQLRTARLLRELPLVVDAVLDGILTPQQAAVLTRLVGKITPDALLESQPHLIEVAAAMDPAQLGVWVAHQIATHCEPALDADHAAAHDKRYLTSRREADGSLFGRFRLTAEDSETLLTALVPLARKAGDADSRTAGQRRADALVELAEQVVKHGELPDAGGLRPQLSYVLPADWAAGQQQQATCTACGPRCPDHPPLTFTDTVDATLPGRGGLRAQQPARPARGPARRPEAASRRCCATPASPASCSPRPARSPASSPYGSRSPRPNDGTSPPATCTASSEAAPDPPPCATPTTCDGVPTAAPPLWTTWCSCVEGTTSCGTKASSSSTTCTSPGTANSKATRPTRSTSSSPEPDHDPRDAVRGRRPVVGSGVRSGRDGHVRRSLMVLSVLVACCACAAQPDEQVLGPNAEVTVCVGTSGQHAAGDDARLEIVSEGEVLAEAVLPVPGEVVLRIPDTAPDPRLLLDGEEWASSPQGGGWGVSRGEGCPVT